MVTDLHAKNQVNIYKCLEKKSGKLFDRWNLLSQKPIISPKIDGVYETQTRSVSHGDWLTCQKSGQYLQAFKKTVQKTNTADWQTDGLTEGRADGWTDWQSANLKSPSASPVGD